DDDALAVAVARARFTGRQPLFEHEKALAVVQQLVLLRGNEDRRRLNLRAVLLDAHFDEVPAHRTGVRFVPQEDGDLSAIQPPRLAVLLEVNRAERDEDALPAHRRRSGRAWRRVARDAH